MAQQMSNEYVNFGEFTLDNPFSSSDTEFYMTAVLAEYDMERDREGGIIQVGRISVFGKDDDRVREVIAYSGVQTNGQESDGRKKFILQVAIADDGSTLMRGLANDDDGTDDVNNVISENIHDGQYPVNSRVRITVDAAMWARFNNLIDQFSPVNEKPLRQGECVCAGQPISLDDNDELYPGTDQWVGIAKESKCRVGPDLVTVTYAAIGGLACEGIHDLASSTRVYAGIEEDPTVAPTGAPLATGLMPDGDYEYVVTLVQETCQGDRESLPSPLGAVTLANGSAIGSVDLTTIPVGLYMNTAKRNIYRKRLVTGAPAIVNYALAGTASASSESVGFEAGKANDGNFSTYWLNDIAQPISTTDAVWSVDLGSIETIDRTELTWFVAGFVSNDYIVETSPDNLIWTQQGPAITSGYGTGSLTTFFPAPVLARYVRLTFAAGSGTDPNYIAILQIKAQGIVTPAGPTKYQLVDTIGDNTTTTYLDIKEDADLVDVEPPTASSMLYDLGQTDLGSNILVGIAEGPGCVRIFLDCNISYFIATQLQAEAGTNNTALMTPLRTYEAFLAFMKDHGAFWVRARMTGFQREVFWSQIHKDDANIEYRVYRTAVFNGNPAPASLIATVPNGTFLYTDPDLITGTIFYRVVAFNTSFTPNSRADSTGDAIFEDDGVLRIACGDYGDGSDGDLVVTSNINLASGGVYQYNSITLNGANITLTGGAANTVIMCKNDFLQQNGNININYRGPDEPDFPIMVCTESRTLADPVVAKAGGAPSVGEDYAACLALPVLVGPTGGAGGSTPTTRGAPGNDGNVAGSPGARIPGVGALPATIGSPNGNGGANGLFVPQAETGFGYSGSGAGAGSHGLSRAGITIIIGGDVTADAPSDYIGLGAVGGAGGTGGAGDKGTGFAINPGGGGGGGASGEGGNGGEVKLFHDSTSIVIFNAGAILTGGAPGLAGVGGIGGWWDNGAICAPGIYAANGQPGVSGNAGATGAIELISVN